MRVPLLVVVALSTACATTHLARPVGRGNTRVSASLGGPLVEFAGAPIPVPMSTVGVAHGVTESVDVHGELHPTAATHGVGGITAGAAWHPLASHPSALTVGGTLGTFFTTEDALLLADVWLSGGGKVASWLWLGGGVHNTLRVATSAPGETIPWAPTLFGLVAFRLSRRVTFDLELRWYALASCGQCVAIAYYAPGSVGALGVILGVDYQFGGGAW